MKYPSLTRAAFILQEAAFRQNLSLISEVALKADVEIILALKAFSFWPAFEIAKDYLPGATASSLNEALLVKKHFGVDPHVYAPAYVPDEFEQVAKISHQLTFNSLGELDRYRSTWASLGTSVGLRVNPMYSPVETDLYNPASPVGRLGEAMDELPTEMPEGLEGIHVHTLCESSAAATETLIAKVEEGLGHWLPNLKWLNLGGGHLMTKSGYDVDRLVLALQGLRKRHPQLSVTLEPGSAHAWRAGILVAHVLDIVTNHGTSTLMLDVSFTCHMPDTLEMPYRPEVEGASTTPVDGYHEYRLGGVSCLAGDYLDTYYFPEKVEIGQELIFLDMLHYTTVKTTMFNGVQHPDLALERQDGEVEILRRFEYADFERRLG